MEPSQEKNKGVPFDETPFIYPFPRSSFRPEELELYLYLFLADILTLSFCIFLGLEIRSFLGKFFSDLPVFNFEEHFWRLCKNCWLFFPIPLVFIWQGLYRRSPFWEEIRRLWLSLTQGFILVYALVSLSKMGLYISRLSLFLSLISACIIFPLSRYFLKFLIFKFRRFRIPALICPARPEGEKLFQALQAEKTLGYEVIGFLDDNPQKIGKIIQGKKVFGPLRQAGKLARLKGVDAVFVILNGRPLSQLEELYSYLQRNVREIFFVPEFMGLGLLNAELSFFFSQRMAFIRIKNPLGNRFNQIFKRLFDIIASCILLILLSPLMLLIAIAIKVDSPGPIFFTQERVGRKGRIFKIYKFRTMFVNAEKKLKACLAEDPDRLQKWLIYRKLDNDPRVTRIGKFLRRFSLDELPQLINVLKGDMSLVGPRPAIAEELKIYYGDKLHFYTAVRPGITGLWQVSGRNKLSFQERVKLDLWYVQNWSPWLDFIILLRTIPAVIRCEGSY